MKSLLLAVIVLSLGVISPAFANDPAHPVEGDPAAVAPAPTAEATPEHKDKVAKKGKKAAGSHKKHGKPGQPTTTPE